MRICIRCYVSGTVQGVWYRGSARQQAMVLGITGYARNLDDGRVEVLACGEEDAVTAFRQWLWQGPRWARVSDVHWEPVEIAEDRDYFEVI